MTKQAKVLNYMRMFGSIEPMTALNECGCYRLSGAIWSLRKQGYDISTSMVDSIDRFGNPVTYAKYTLRE